MTYNNNDCRYTAHLTCDSSAKARLRTVLKLMGGKDIIITEKPVEAGAPKPRKDNVPTSPEALAVAALFGRKPDQQWSDGEISLFRKVRQRGVLTPENLTALTRYYLAERKKGDEGIHRRDLSTFLRNVDGEIDRAKTAKPKAGKALEWTDSTPKLTVLPSPAEEERLRAAGKEAMAAAKEQIRRGAA